MTPQEAKAELEEEFEVFKNSIDPADWKNPNEELKKIIEANTMAIDILGQEPCGDCISRQVLKEMLTAEWTKYMPMELDMNLSFVLDKISALPSVTPQPKKGHWINLGVMPSDLGDYRWCSNCNRGIDAMEFHRNHYNYCPNCGAKMEVEG